MNNIVVLVNDETPIREFIEQVAVQTRLRNLLTYLLTEQAIPVTVGELRALTDLDLSRLPRMGRVTLQMLRQHFPFPGTEGLSPEARYLIGKERQMAAALREGNTTRAGQIRGEIRRALGKPRGWGEVIDAEALSVPL